MQIQTRCHTSKQSVDCNGSQIEAFHDVHHIAIYDSVHIPVLERIL